MDGRVDKSGGGRAGSVGRIGGIAMLGVSCGLLEGVEIRYIDTGGGGLSCVYGTAVPVRGIRGGHVGAL